MLQIGRVNESHAVERPSHLRLEYGQLKEFRHFGDGLLPNGSENQLRGNLLVQQIFGNQLGGLFRRHIAKHYHRSSRLLDADHRFKVAQADTADFHDMTIQILGRGLSFDGIHHLDGACRAPAGGVADGDEGFVARGERIPGGG